MCADQQNKMIFQVFEGLYTHHTPSIRVFKHMSKNADTPKTISQTVHSAHSSTMRKFTSKIEIVLNSEMLYFMVQFRIWIY